MTTSQSHLGLSSELKFPSSNNRGTIFSPGKKQTGGDPLANSKIQGINPALTSDSLDASQNQSIRQSYAFGERNTLPPTSNFKDKNQVFNNPLFSSDYGSMPANKQSVYNTNTNNQYQSVQPQ